MRRSQGVRSTNSDEGVGGATLLVALVAALLATRGTEVLAADECGVETPGATALSCTDAAYSSGINYGTEHGNFTNDIDGLTLTIDNPAMVIEAPSDAYGAIGLRSPFFENVPITGDLVVNVLNAATITNLNLEGILVLNEGMGNVFVTLGNASVVAARNGIYATNDVGFGNPDSLATVGITIQGGSISAPNGAGALAIQGGTGDVFVRMTGGQISASQGLEARASNYGLADVGYALVEIAGGTLTTTGFGARAFNSGDGDAAVSMTAGSVATTDAGAYGLSAETAGPGNVMVSISGGSVGAAGQDADGIFARAVGGHYTIDIDGATLSSGSANASAIHVVAAGGGSIDIGSGATVDGLLSGIAIRDGDDDRDGVDENGGNTLINTSGTVTGNVFMGLGNDTINLAGGSLDGDIYGDDSVASGNDGNDTFNWTGGLWGSSFFALNGSDIVNISAAAFDDHHVLDGGDDVSTADGWADTLTFNGINAVTNGANLMNWETLTVNGGQLTLLDGAITVGSDPGTGLFLQGGGNLDGSAQLALTGNLSIASGSSFIATGGGTGSYSILGNVGNGGTITAQDGGVGDVLIVNGDYGAVNGSLRLDTVLGDQSSATDRLVVNGNTSGTTRLFINNVGGLGALTDANGINVVEVNGASSAPGAFTLNGDYITRANQPAVVAGAYSYSLYYGGVGADANNGNWYLRSQLSDLVGSASAERYQPGVPIYESYPQSLLALSGLPTMNQRVGNQYWPDAELAGSEMVFCKDGKARKGGQDDSGVWCSASLQADDAAMDSDAAIESGIRRKGGSWTRVTGGRSSVELTSSTSASDYDNRLWKLQTGVDAVVQETDAGALVAGLMAFYGSIETDVQSAYGDGNVDTRGYGIGATLTWFGSQGVYVDAQALASFFASDLSSRETGHGLEDSNNGNGYTLSVESGKRIRISPQWTLTPQAQLLYSRVNFDSFSDAFGTKVSLDDGDSLQGRIGLALERQTTWKDEGSRSRRSNVYAVANVYNEFLDGTQVDVADVKFTSRSVRLWGGVGIGGACSWGNDSHSIYGELSTNTSLESFADSYSVAGTVGYRYRF